MCGLFGYVGQTMPNIDKIRILGIFNQSRGEHSCGVYINNELIKGVNEIKKWTDFIGRKELPKPETNSVVIGHTRYATLGAHTDENAHPFMINDRLIGAHNGTIENIKELAEKYNVDTTGITVDSKILYKIIEETGTFDVLADYIGYAALLFNYIDQPNVFYAYHGASREIANQGIYIERPMHYIVQNQGFYFSSMKESLSAIMDVKEDSEGKVIEVRDLPHNKVFRFDYTIPGREPTVECVYMVDREETNVNIAGYKLRNRAVVSYPAYNGGSHYTNPNLPFHKTDFEKNVTGTGHTTTANKNPSKSNRIVPEDINTFSDYAVYFRARYTVQSKNMHGIFRLNQEGRVWKVNEPAPDSLITYYFYNGVLIRDHETWNRLTRHEHIIEKRTATSSFARIISKYSMYPVMVLFADTSDIDVRQSWYWEGKMHRYLSFAPKFSRKTYEVFNGIEEVVEYTQTLNKGAVTESVWTEIERDIYKDISPSYDDFFLFDKVFSSIQELSMDIPSYMLEFIFNYVIESKFQNGKPSEKEVNEYVHVKLDEAITDKKSLRDLFEIDAMSFEEAFELLGHSETLIDEDEDEIENEIIVNEKSMEELQNELKEELKKTDSEENTEFIDTVESVVSNVLGLAKDAYDLTVSDDRQADELGELINVHVHDLKCALIDYFTKNGLGEYSVDLTTKLSKIQQSLLV